MSSDASPLTFTGFGGLKLAAEGFGNPEQPVVLLLHGGAMNRRVWRDAAVALAAADVHLVTLLSGCEQLVFPSKLYGVAAAGRPVAFIGPADCEVARLVREEGLGVAGTPDRLAELAASLRQLQADPDRRSRHGAAAVHFAAAHDAGHAVARWQTLLQGLRACDVVPSRGRLSRHS